MILNSKDSIYLFVAIYRFYKQFENKHLTVFYWILINSLFQFSFSISSFDVALKSSIS